MQPSLYSFFAGAGFLDLGFESAGFDLRFVNEIHEPFMDAYRHSRKILKIQPPSKGYSIGSIDRFLEPHKLSWLKDQVILDQRFGPVGFIGGPPCPDFSIAGKNRGKEGGQGRLSKSYVSLICQTKPSFFLFENVKGLWKTKRHRAFYEELKRDLSEAGYSLNDRLVNALEYGVPQDRDRIILLGFRKEQFTSEPFGWDKSTKYALEQVKSVPWPKADRFVENSVSPKPMCILEDLTTQYWFAKNDVDHHPNASHAFTPRAGLPKFQTIMEGDDSKKSYKRLHRWRYSPTAAYGNNEVHLHPYRARRLSAAEALAIQSLPKEFELPAQMTLSNMFKCIGNGVPFLLSLALANQIKNHLIENEKGYSRPTVASDRATA